MPRQFFDHEGTSVQPGNRIGVGGEGAVFDIVGYPDWVVKIYHRQVKPDKVAKLQLMAQLATPDLMQFAAWPRTIVYEKSGKDVIASGVIIRRIKQARPIHELYSPTQRRDHFPKADWRFLIRTARNCARAFGSLHNHGIVIGDVNQGNLLASQSAEVRFIDCDSFQVSLNGTMHFCQVGVPHFTPPELHSVNLSAVARTQHHDGFGLAVLIFHLLFMGRHPFSGKYVGAGDMPIERAIREFRFAYGPNARQGQMEPPPKAIRLEHVSKPLGQLFERAFLSKIRPVAKEWDTALEEFETQLAKCNYDPGHYHFAHLKSCPWCGIVGEGGPNFFISVTVQVLSGRNTNFDVNALWSEVDRVSPPLFAVSQNSLKLKRYTPQPISSDIKHELLPQKLTGFLTLLGITLTWFGLIHPAIAIFGIAVTLIFGIYWFLLHRNSPIEAERREREKKLIDSEKKLAENALHRDSLVNSRIEQFDAEKSRLATAHLALNELSSERTRELNALAGNVRLRQLESYLDGVYVCHAHIKGIGPTKQAALQSYGVETALDIAWYRINVIPGFGAKLAAELMAWRQSIESRFVFDPSKGVQQSDKLALEVKYQQRSAHYADLLLKGKYKLHSIARTAELEVSNFDRRTSAMEDAVGQARADYRAVFSKDSRIMMWIINYLYPSHY